MSGPADIVRRTAQGIGGALSGFQTGVGYALKGVRKAMDPELKDLGVDAIFSFTPAGFEHLANARLRAQLAASEAAHQKRMAFYDDLEKSHAEFTRTLAIPAYVRNPTTERWTKMSEMQKREIAAVEKARRIRRTVALEMMGVHVDKDPEDLVPEGVNMADVEGHDEEGVGGGIE